jgi:hypothetical protein
VVQPKRVGRYAVFYAADQREICKHLKQACSK